MIDNDIDHRARKGSFVRLIIDEWIRSYPHFMIENICIVFCESDGLLVSNKMYLVTFVGECFTEFRGQDAASTERRVTNNSNPHVLILLNEVKQIFLLHIRTAPGNTYLIINKHLCVRFCLVPLFFY